MLQRIRDRVQSEEGGFTLIELLVVILIIGILAAIAIPAFLNQRGKSQDAAAKSLARTAQTAMETCATDNSGSYASCNTSALTTIEPTLNDSKFTGSGAGVTANNANSYTVTAKSDNGSNTATISRTSSGTVTRGGTGMGSW